jgi:hypothetical protein
MPATAEAPTNSDLIRHQTARQMAKVYHECTEEIQRLGRQIAEQTQLLAATFAADEGEVSGRYQESFGLDFRFNGEHDDVDDMKRIMPAFKRAAWAVMVNRLGVINIMSVKKRQEFELCGSSRPPASSLSCNTRTRGTFSSSVLGCAPIWSSLPAASRGFPPDDQAFS